MIDFVEEYRNLIILQYQDKPKARAELGAFLDRVAVTYDWLRSFFHEFDIDEAYGDRLDIIGRIVGIDRTVENVIPKPYFGWDGSGPNPQTFGEGPLFDLFLDSGYTATQLNDDQMRFLIRAKIVKNSVRPFLSADGATGLQEAYLFLFRSQGYVVDNKDMTITAYVDDDFDTKLFDLLQQLDLFPRPQAVGLKFIITYSDQETFGFSENPNAKTFGQGKFAELLI